MISIVDTDALYASINTKDALHDQVIQLTRRLESRGVDTFFLPTTLTEFALLCTKRMDLVTSQRAVKEILSSPYIHLAINEEITHEAVAIYQKQTSKEESLVDCFNMVAAKVLSADCIFSFDHGYTKNGFVLAEDWVQSHSS